MYVATNVMLRKYVRYDIFRFPIENTENRITKIFAKENIFIQFYSYGQIVF